MIYRGSVPVKVTRNDVLAIRYALRYSPGGRVCFAFLSALSPDGVRVVCGVFRLRYACVYCGVCGIVLKYTVTCDPDAHRLHFSLYVSSLLHVRYGNTFTVLRG